MDRAGTRCPEISVIMLTYNREMFVGRAIESIIAQSFQDFEFIIVDNGSTDHSGKIAEKYAKEDPRIRVIHIPKSNIGTGRNVGLDAERGNYITFIDDDDFAEPDMLEFLYRLAVENGADISICGSDKIVAGKRVPNCVFDERILMTKEEAIITFLKRKKYSAGMPAKLFKKTVLGDVRFSSDGKYEDIHTTYKYFAAADKVIAYGLPKYCITRHEGNSSAFTTNDLLLTPEQLNEYFTAFRERTQYLSEYIPAVADYAQYSEWSYMISMCNKIEKNHLTNCDRQLAFVKEELSTHYEEFYNSPYIEEFEKEFMRKYIVLIYG